MEVGGYGLAVCLYAAKQGKPQRGKQRVAGTEISRPAESDVGGSTEMRVGVGIGAFGRSVLRAGHMVPPVAVAFSYGGNGKRRDMPLVHGGARLWARLGHRQSL